MTDFTAWSHYISYSQPGSIDEDKTNYPVPITIPYQNFMRPDFGDIRFALQDGTELKYCIDNLVEGDHCDFLVVFPSLPASPAMTTIWVYGGNSSVTTTSDPSAVYLMYDDATGTYSDNWSNYQGSGSYAVVDGKQSISLTAATTNILGNKIISAPFKIEADLFATSLITAIQYCQDNTPDTNDHYHARIDTRGNFQDSILKDQNIILNSNVSSSANAWHHMVLTLDQNGKHTLTIDGTVLGSVTDTTYTSGYISLNHHNEGTGAIANLKISKYTANPPNTGSFGTWTANGLIISTPPATGVLTANTPQIVLGGAMTITIPPATGVLTANPPTLHAIISSPPAQGALTAIPPIIAFLMEVKAGVTYNPDAINDLKEDGVPCNISFNVTIGGQQYE